MKSIANDISIARIILVLLLIFTKPLSAVFYIVYLICGISDMLDGYIARKTNTTSKLGEKLDSIADFIMIAVLIILLYPIVKIPNTILSWIVIIAIIRIISVFIVFIKFKTFGMLHTYGNKITGLMLFLYPIFFGINQSVVIMYVLCITASITAVEELFINLLSNEFQANPKSIFTKD